MLSGVVSRSGLFGTGIPKKGNHLCESLLWVRSPSDVLLCEWRSFPRLKCQCAFHIVGANQACNSHRDTRSFQINTRVFAWISAEGILLLKRDVLTVFSFCMEEITVIHLIPKWRPINYSFVCMLISPLRLIFTTKFFCFLHMLTRRRGLINMETKE